MPRTPRRRTPPTAPLAFAIRDSVIAGRGGFAIRAIAKGERLIEYVGQRITHAQADARYDDEAMDQHHTFLFSVSNRTVIDASVGGNEARFLNHSCDPNCEAVIERSRVFIYAIRDIAEGEELVYDYQYERSGDEDDSDEHRYRCLCRTARCRGSIMEPKADFVKRQRAKARARRSKRSSRSKHSKRASRS